MKPASRRAVLRSALLGLLAACSGQKRGGTGASDSVPGGGDSSDSGDGGETALPCATGAPGADWTPLALSAYPALAEVGGAASVSLGGVSVLVAQIYADCFVALAQTCTHQGCAIEFRPYTEGDGGGRFVCPCHGALFGYDGAVLGGPAPVGVATYAAVREGDTVWVQGP